MLASWPERQRQLQRLIYKAQPLEGDEARSQDVGRSLTIEIPERSAAEQGPESGYDPEAAFSGIACNLGAEASMDVLIPDRWVVFDKCDQG